MSQLAQATAADIVKSTVQAVLDGIESGSIDSVRGRLEALSGQLLVSRPASTGVTVCKIDAPRRMVYGWAWVSTVGGQEITDRQGDVVDMGEVTDTAHDFIGKRLLGVMHENTVDIGEIRESLVFDAKLQQALGIDLGKEGWFVGAYVKDNATWARVQKGELRAFSIGGTGIREPILERTITKQARQRLREQSRGFARGPGRVALFAEVLTAMES